MHSTILASSTGWNSNCPTWTHSRAPLMVLAEVGDQGEQQQDDARRPAAGSGSGRGPATAG